MIKKCVIIALAASLCFVGCAKASAHKEVKPEKKNEISELSKIKETDVPQRDGIEFDMDYYDFDTKELHMIFANNTQETFIYSEYFKIYNYNSGVWEEILPREDFTVNDLAYELSPNQSAQVVCDLKAYGELDDRLFYLIVKDGVSAVVNFNHINAAEKPVIYFYPECERKIKAELLYNGKLTCTYPLINGGWNFTAYPDGTLVDENGMSYNYLYWEGEDCVSYDFSKGYCVKGSDTAKFLEEVLPRLGLTRKEANEFIIYWLPRMQENPYNVISFQGETYTQNAVLRVEPEPDTMIRVFMAWYGTDSEVAIEPQNITTPVRDGFTVVEWGGSEIK